MGLGYFRKATRCGPTLDRVTRERLGEGQMRFEGFSGSDLTLLMIDAPVLFRGATA